LSICSPRNEPTSAENPTGFGGCFAENLPRATTGKWSVRNRRTSGKDTDGFSLVIAVLATRQQAAHLGGILRVRNECSPRWSKIDKCQCVSEIKAETRLFLPIPHLIAL